jgi:hypothetical protein
MKHFVSICCGSGRHWPQVMVAASPKNRSFRQAPRACRVHTRVNAKRVFRRVRVQPVAPCGASARPEIILGLSYHPGLDRIPFDIFSDPVPFVLVSHPMIVRFAPPELLSGTPEQLICFPRSTPLERLEQFAWRDLRKQKNVDMVRHDRKRPELVMTKLRAFEKRINHTLCYSLLFEKRWPGASLVQIAVHPNEGFTRGALRRRCEPRAWKTAVQVPSDEQPAPFRVNMWKSALRVHTTVSVISPGKLSVAHALVRAVFALLRTQAFENKQGVHTSVNAARRSACATGQ